jgi:glycosyltransferase involved in cell wall biosynthesis
MLHGSDFGQEDGEERELRAYARDAEADIRFVPPTLDPRITLAACDVMATLAEREGAPNIFIEAFATGRPVLATDLPGHSIYVRHTREGLLVPVGDIDAAADGLRYLDEHRFLREGMGMTAWHTAEHFDIAHTARDYLYAFSATRSRKRSHA